MLTLAQIQTDVQFLADESNLTLFSAANLPAVNGFYREFSASRRFPELEVTDTSITTVSNQEGYVWPSNRQFLTEPAIAIQRTIGNPRNFTQIWPVPDNIYWAFLKNVVISFPSHYKKEKVDIPANTNSLAYQQSLSTVSAVFAGATTPWGGYVLLLRPVPNVTGLQVYILGQVAPPELVQSTDRTVFTEINTDRAFARFIAAQFQAKRGNLARAGELLDDMDMLLPEGNYGPTMRPNNAIPWTT